ncbi:MAG: 3-oxoacyl-ACP synthase, partial [Deltaproteobacteria bacterium]|nr:3-oxoacyl-ACP synthase [Deltaproteobacteria bacterium]
SGILSSHLYSDGKSWQLLYSPTTIQSSPFEKKGLRHDQPYLRMKGNDIFKLAVRSMSKAITKALKESGIGADDVSLLIPHQANIRIIKAMQERLKLPDERVFTNVEHYGNTSAASIPIALNEANKAGRLKKGDIVVLVAFGGGLTWACSVVRW